MAILGDAKIEEYNKIQVIIDEVINVRKFKFNIKTILTVIREKVLANGINDKLLECSYFYILVFKALDNFIEKGKLYKLDNEYIPSDFLIFVDFCPTPSRLLYYINDECAPNKKSFIDIDSLEEISCDMVKSLDFILCGGYSDDIDSEYKLALQSDVSLEEITHLYHDLINEGASKDEAIIHLLNYYKIQSMPRNLNLANEFIGQKPQIKKLSRKKIIHD